MYVQHDSVYIALPEVELCIVFRIKATVSVDHRPFWCEQSQHCVDAKVCLEV